MLTSVGCKRQWQFFVAAIAMCAMCQPASAADTAAIFPFDIRDVSQEGELVPQLNPEDQRRMKMVADELKVLMEKDGRYKVIDLAPIAKEVEAASPFSRCNGCEAPLAKQAGATLAVTGYVDKLSDALISLQLFAREAETGKVVKTMSAEIRGNTDELWMHGIRWLWKNRFNVEAKAP